MSPINIFPPLLQAHISFSYNKSYICNISNRHRRHMKHCCLSLLLLLGHELPLMVESFALLDDIFPFPSILDAGYPVFNLHLANILFDIILPSIFGSSL